MRYKYSSKICKVKFAVSVNLITPVYTLDHSGFNGNNRNKISNTDGLRRHNNLDILPESGVMFFTCKGCKRKGAWHEKRRDEEGGRVEGERDLQCAGGAGFRWAVCGRRVFRRAGHCAGEVRDAAAGAKRWCERSEGLGGIRVFPRGVLRYPAGVDAGRDEWIAAPPARPEAWPQADGGCDRFYPFGPDGKPFLPDGGFGGPYCRKVRYKSASAHGRAGVGEGAKKRASGINGGCISADYERLRSYALKSPTYAQNRWGMALFLQRGFLAWSRAWDQVLPIQEKPVSSGETVSLPASVQGSMVMALAGMVLGALGGEVV